MLKFTNIYIIIILIHEKCIIKSRKDDHYEKNNGIIRQGVNYEEFTIVFKVFENFPFFESWTAQEVQQEYNKFNDNGYIFGYYLNGQCVSVITLRPYVKGEHPVVYPKNAKVIYLSDVATLFEYRNKGIGTELFQFAISHFRVLGYEHIYLRTNEENSMSYGIAKKCGFMQIWDLCQEVEKTRTDGTISKDLRIFMEKNL